MFTKILYLILPILLGGLCNMIFVKSPLLARWKVPLDGGRNWRDGKRWLGDNQTVQGFIGMIVFTALWFAVFHHLAQGSESAYAWSLIPYRDFSRAAALCYGALWGLGYVLAELPNSFIKRRLDIAPGKNSNGAARHVFIFFDQADSVIGCLLAMLVFYAPPWPMLLAIGAVAVGVHFAMNFLLYALGLKQQYL